MSRSLTHCLLLIPYFLCFIMECCYKKNTIDGEVFLENLPGSIRTYSNGGFFFFFFFCHQRSIYYQGILCKVAKCEKGKLQYIQILCYFIFLFAFFKKIA